VTILDAPPRAYPTRGGAALAPAPERRSDPRPAPIPSPAERARHLRVVAPSERVRRRLTPAMGVLLTGLLFATLFAIATAHTLLVQGQIRLDDLDSQLTVEQARYQELRKEVAEMESPTRVVTAAQGLGMVAPDDLVYLQPDVADPTSGEPPSAPAGAGSATRTDPPDDAEVAGDAGSGWSVMKPLLEAPAP
jgi:cell division protein FtsL